MPFGQRPQPDDGRWLRHSLDLSRNDQNMRLRSAIDPGFRNKYVEYLDTQISKNFAGRSRQLVQVARGTIDRWAKESEGTDGLLETSISLNKIGSEILHHAIGLSGEAEEIVKARPEILKMLGGRTQCAVAKVLLAIQVIEEHHTPGLVVRQPSLSGSRRLLFRPSESGLQRIRLDLHDDLGRESL